MVDFAAKLKELKDWKQRRHKLDCACAAEHPKTCWELTHDTLYQAKTTKQCKCPCHVKIS
jgi:hypothetical protein